jgi:hypothetical protein
VSFRRGAANVVEGSASPFSLAEALVGNLTWPLLALAGVGLLSARAAPAHLRAGLLGIAVAGGLLSLGPAVPLVPGTLAAGSLRTRDPADPGLLGNAKAGTLCRPAPLGARPSRGARHLGVGSTRRPAGPADRGGPRCPGRHHAPSRAQPAFLSRLAPARMEGRAPGIPLPVLRTSVRAPEMAV